MYPHSAFCRASHADHFGKKIDLHWKIAELKAKYRMRLISSKGYKNLYSGTPIQWRLLICFEFRYFPTQIDFFKSK